MQPKSGYREPVSALDPPAACPLCGCPDVAPFHRDARREYLRCGNCLLVFVPPRNFLPRQDERACYDLHRNSPHDAAYRRFLSRLFDPLVARLPSGAHGLDFGSGPGPTLSVMLAEAGFPTAIYDPFYAPDRAVLGERYDFVTATEVVEHLHRPMADLGLLWSRLRPGGLLGIMTKRVIGQKEFAAWHYKHDPTHVIFFAEETFGWLAETWRADLEIIGPDVVLLGKGRSD